MFIYSKSGAWHTLPNIMYITGGLKSPALLEDTIPVASFAKTGYMVFDLP